MTIKQLSIFMENRPGSLVRILRTLAAGGISIIVSTLGDTEGFGIYRIICSDAEKAFRILREKGISATVANVYAIRLHEDKPGTAAKVMEDINAYGVNVKYMYSFVFGGHGIIVFRADNADKADEAVMLGKMDYLTEQDLSN